MQNFHLITLENKNQPNLPKIYWHITIYIINVIVLNSNFLKKLKHKNMKKLLAIAAITFSLTACNDNSAGKAGDTTDTVSSPTENAPAVADSTSTTGTMKDGVMTMKDGKMMVMIAGKWEPMTEEVTTTNGRKVSLNGEVSKGDKKKKLEEGMMIDKDGQMTDKDGKMLDDTGW